MLLVCDKCDYSKEEFNARLKLGIDGFEPDRAEYCPKCGGVLKIFKESVAVEDLNFVPAYFKSLSDKDKKAVLKARNKRHTDKHQRSDINNKRHDAVQSIKQKFLNQ